MIVLKVNGKSYDKWADIDINLKLNSVVSTFDLTAFSEDDTKDLFNPFSYTECEVWIIDADKGINEKLITGFLVNPAVSIQKVPKMSRVTGMSKTGILVNTSMPLELYPLQRENISLAEICREISDFFNLKLTIHPGAQDQAAKKYKEIKCTESETIYAFLARIAKERGITIAHDNEGALFIYRIINVTPATSRISEEDNEISMYMACNGQGMHTEITVIKDTDADSSDKEGIEATENVSNDYTVRSPFLSYINVTRGNITKQVKLPKTVKMSNSNSESAESYAKFLMCNEARNFPLIISKPDWDFEGRIVRSGFYLIADAPTLDINNEKFVVEDMKFSKTAKTPEILTFTCLLPCVYTGVLPYTYPYKSPYVKIN